ncbi:MAG: hypothetical protein AAFR05_15120, partial [Bacteroidota bacterium]
MNRFYQLLSICSFVLCTVLPHWSQAQCGAGQTLFTNCYDNNETNLIIFEVCPTAGMAAQANIIAGNYAAPDNLTVYEGPTGSGASGTLFFGPSSGDLSGFTITGSTADNCLIFVSNSDVVFSCVNGGLPELQVCGESIAPGTVQFVAPDDLCINAGLQTGLGGGLPTGGTYSGPGVTDDGNGLTYSFDPAVAGVGSSFISYSAGGNTAMDVTEVFAIPTVTFTAPADLCIDAGLQLGLGGGTPTGGVYSGPGVMDDGNGLTYTFNPAIAGLGVHTITYTEGSPCQATAMDDLEVLAACSCPVGQNTFFHCYDNNENDLVIFEICPAAGMAAQATINQGVYGSFADNLTVYQGLTGSSTSGVVVFGPASGDLSGTVVTGNIADNCLIFVSNTDPLVSCQDGDVLPLVVCGEDVAPSVVFTAPADRCVDAGVQTGLSGGLPTGGVYSGPGVTDDGNGLTYSFDPAAAGVGVQTLSYAQGGSMATDAVEVLALPMVTFTAPADLCIDEGVQTNLGGGLPVGGVYSGPGVTDDGNGLTYTFNPAFAGLGVQTITYTDGDCGVTATDQVEVLAACGCPMGETSFFYCYGNNETNVVAFEICPLAGEFAEAEIAAGVIANDDFLTVYQGVTGSGTAGTIVSGPSSGNLVGTTITSPVADECLIFVINSSPLISCQDGFQAPLEVCGRSLSSNVTFTAFGQVSINAGVQTGLSGGLPTGGVYSGPGVTDDGNGMTYSFDPLVAGLGTITLTYTVGMNSASDQVEVLNIIPPGFSKSFSPNQIGPGSVSRLTFTIDNSASASPRSNLAFTDNLPAGMTVASPAGITTDCFSGTITAPEGGSTITLSDGQLTGGGVCTITVNVTSSTAGTSTNTTGDLTSDAGNSATASANLTVNTDRPGVSKSISPASVNRNGRARVTITLDNTAGTTGFVGITLTDNLPLGMVLADPVNLVATNTGGGTFVAEPGSNLFSYNTTSFTEEIAAGGTCSFSFDVIGETVGQLDNVTENITVRNPFFQFRDCGLAAASLEVLPTPEIFIEKSFSDNTVLPGGTTDLEFTITNFSRNFTAENIAFTDDLAAFISGASASGTPLSDICGTGSQLSGTSTLIFSGGMLAPGASCTFSVPITIPAGTALGTYTNATSAVTATVNGAPVTGNVATRDLFVVEQPIFTKTFLTNPVLAGSTTTLEFTITNTSTTQTLSDLTFTDNISQFINGATISSLPAAGSCGTGSLLFTTISAGETVFTVQDANIPPGGSCTFSIDITIPVEVPSGDYTNTTSTLPGDINGTSVSAPPATDDLTIVGFPRLTKTFLDDPVNAGDIVNLEFTITYDAGASADATSIAFTDDLNAVIPGLAAVGLPLNDICGTGSSISGTTNLTFSGGNLSPGQSCTFSIPVQVPTGVVPGNYANTTSAPSATIGSLSGTGRPATDVLNIGGLNLSKEFLDDEVIAGQLTTLRFTIENTTAFDATGILFTDNLSNVLSGIAAEAPPTMGCGGTLIASGSNFLILTGGSLLAGETCTFDVPIRVPANAANGTYSNTTSNLTASVNGTTVISNAAVDRLTVNNDQIQLTKSFTDDPVLPGGTVNLQYMLTNLSTTDVLSNVAFTDDLDAALSGLAAVGLPLNSVCGPGSQLSGTSTLSFTGGSLAPGASCTFNVSLQVPSNAPFGASLPSTTSMVTGTLNGLNVTGAAATDNLLIESLEFTKSIAGPVRPGQTTTITFSITNNNPTDPISDIAFTDDLDAFISGMTATGLPLNDICGTGSRLSGSSVLTFGRGALNPGQTCSFDVTVLVPCGTASGTYTNTTSTITGLGVTGGTATATLTVNNTLVASFTAPADLCLDAGVQGNLSGGMPVQGTATGDLGVYSGPGVTDNGDGTYGFNPATAGAGIATITYTYTDEFGCSASAMDDIEVFAVPNVSLSDPGDFCVDAGVQLSLGDGMPLGGSYGGSGVTDNGDGTYDFDPAGAGVGVHTITYTFTDTNGCSGSASVSVEVFAVPTITFTAPVDLCVDAGVQPNLMGGMPTGGSFSGPGVLDNGDGTYDFDPAMAGVGTHTITYTFTNTNGCGGTAMDDIEVFALPNVTLVLTRNEYCLNDPVDVQPVVGNPTGGTYSGPGVTSAGVNLLFDPAAAGVGVHTITYTFTDGNGCTNSATALVEVFALPTVSFAAPADLCIDAGVQMNLSGGTPAPGTVTGDLGSYSGPGVTDNGDGTYDFAPMMAGVGVHTITYAYTDGNGCTASASDDIEVFALPIVSFTAPADLCIDAGIQTSLSGGLPAQGTVTGDLGAYAGPGVTDNGDGTYNFNPMMAGVGIHTITYTYTDDNACSASASDDVEVYALPTVSFTALADLCIDAGVQTNLADGMPAQGTATGDLGTYVGPGVLDNGDGTYDFAPMTAGVGVHTIIYTY